MKNEENENTFRLKISKFTNHSLFKKIKEPQIYIKSKPRIRSLNSALKYRKKRIEELFDKTKIQNLEDLITFEDNFKKKNYHKINRKNIHKKINSKNEIKKIEFIDKKTYSLKIKKPKKLISFSNDRMSNKSTNQTNLSFKTNLNTTTEKTNTINNTYNTNNTSNILITNQKENSNEKIIINPFKTFEKNSPLNEKKKLKNHKTRNIRLYYGEYYTENNNKNNNIESLNKIDFNSIDLTKNYNSQNYFNSNKSLDKSKLIEIFVKKRKSIDQIILDIEEKNLNTKVKLKEILKDWHFFPVLSNSFKNDISDIIDKKIEIKRNGRYEIRKIHQNEMFKKIYEKYWDYNIKNPKYESLKEKEKCDLKNIKLKIREELLKAEKMKLNIKLKNHSVLNGNLFRRNSHC